MQREDGTKGPESLLNEAATNNSPEDCSTTGKVWEKMRGEAEVREMGELGVIAVNRNERPVATGRVVFQG